MSAKSFKKKKKEFLPAKKAYAEIKLSKEWNYKIKVTKIDPKYCEENN